MTGSDRSRGDPSVSDPSGSGSSGGDSPDSDVEIVLVAAVAENGVIGAEEGMPWHYPADLAHFKRLTTGNPVIVGRTTYESIVDRLGKPLPERINVVLTTRNPDLPDGAIVANDVDAAMSLARDAAADLGVSTVYVIGGATVYDAFLPTATRLVITEIPESPAGDTHFPEWRRDEWVETDRRADGQLVFVTYDRRT